VISFRRGRFRECIRSPLTWILIACAVPRIVGIGWGLPASDGWDNDGVAPRDFLAGLVETFSPGHYFTYPPFHLLVLGVLTCPITAIALAHAHSLSPHDVVSEILRVPYMTSIAYIARAVSVVMSLGIIYAVAKITETIRGPQAGYCAAAACGLDVSLTYYGHTTNLDVPYLFWASLGLLALVRAIALNEPRRLRRFAVFAILAIATKDQAYALFLLGVPLAIAAWLFFGLGWEREGARTVLLEALRAVGLGAVLLLLADGVVWNPIGFWARLHFLVGPASQDFATYAATTEGRLRVLQDAAIMYGSLWHSTFLVLAGGGLLLHLWRRNEGDRARWVAGWVPLFVAISFTLTFNCIARRVENRFILPQSLMLCVYIGLAVHAFLFELRGHVVRLLARAALAVAFARGIFMALAVDVNILNDPRYDIERTLRAQAAPGDRVETYGLNVYLPRFPHDLRVTRVGPEPVEHRNPMPGIEEIQDRFENLDQRRPRWVVVSECWAWRYLLSAPKIEERGMAMPRTQLSTRNDASAFTFFHDLVEDRRGYRMVLTSEFHSDIWPLIAIHASTACKMWLLESKDPKSQ